MKKSLIVLAALAAAGASAQTAPSSSVTLFGFGNDLDPEVGKRFGNWCEFGIGFAAQVDD